MDDHPKDIGQTQKDQKEQRASITKVKPSKNSPKVGETQQDSPPSPLKRKEQIDKRDLMQTQEELAGPNKQDQIETALKLEQNNVHQNVTHNDEQPPGQETIVVSQSLKKFRQDTPVFTIRNRNTNDQDRQNMQDQKIDQEPQKQNNPEDIKQELVDQEENNKDLNNTQLKQATEQKIQLQQEQEIIQAQNQSKELSEKSTVKAEQQKEDVVEKGLEHEEQKNFGSQSEQPAQQSCQGSQYLVNQHEQQEEIIQNQQIDESAINPEQVAEQAFNQEHLNRSEIKELIETLQEFKKPLKINEKVLIDQLNAQNQELLQDKDDLYELLRQRDEEIKKLKEYIKLLEGQVKSSAQNSFNFTDVSAIKPKNSMAHEPERTFIQNQKDNTIQDVIKPTQEDDKRIETWLGTFEKQLQKNQLYSPLIQQVRNPSINDYLSRKPFSIGKLPSLKKKLFQSVERSTDGDQARFSSKFQNQKRQPTIDHRAQSQKPINVKEEYDLSDEDAERRIQQIFADNEKQNQEESQRSIKLKEYRYKPQSDYEWDNQDRKFSMPEHIGPSQLKKLIKDERVDISPQRTPILQKAHVVHKNYEPQLLTQKKSYYTQALQKQKFKQTQQKSDQKYMSMGEIINPNLNGRASKVNQVISPKFYESKHQGIPILNSQ